MIEVIGKDSSFFLVDCPDIEGAAGYGKEKVNRYLQDKIVSFQVTEEVGKCTIGSLQVYDPNHVYSRVFRNGMRFNVTWGYKAYNANLLEQGVTDSNPNEITGLAERKGLKCVVNNPSGSADQSGGILYNITFYSSEIFSDRIVKLWSSGTYGDVVFDIFSQFGIAAKDMIVDFRKQNSRLSTKTGLRQEEPNYKFLMRMAYEWRVIFQIGYGPRGNRVGLFIDPDKLEKLDYVNKITGAKGFYRTLEYKDGIHNVLSYNWTHHVGENGVGDNVRLSLVNGQVVVQRFQAGTETVKTWKFVPEKMRREMESKDNFTDQTALLKEWLQQDDFDELVRKGYFVEIEATTAPEGFGYTITAKMIGDPLVTTPMRVAFGSGFPDRIRQANPEGKDTLGKALTTFYLKKANHVLNAQGYLMDLEIADAFTVNGGALQ